MIVHIQNVDEYNELIAKGEVLVDFFATWCGPCNMLAPILEQVANENPELTIAKIDVDELGALAQRYNVASIPTLLYFKDGELKNSGLGFMPKPKLLAFIGR